MKLSDMIHACSKAPKELRILDPKATHCPYCFEALHKSLPAPVSGDELAHGSDFMLPASKADALKKVMCCEPKNAQIAELKARIEWLESGNIHTCHEKCQRLPCVQARTITELKALATEAAHMLQQAEEIIRDSLYDTDGEDGYGNLIQRLRAASTEKA